MKAWRWQRGELQAGCIVGAVILLVVALVAIKTVPIVMRVSEFQDEVSRLADRANRRDYPEDRIRKALEKKAQELRLPVGADAMKITKTERTFDIHIEYDLEIVYPGYTYVWHKVHHEERPLF